LGAIVGRSTIEGAPSFVVVSLSTFFVAAASFAAAGSGAGAGFGTDGSGALFTKTGAGVLATLSVLAAARVAATTALTGGVVFVTAAFAPRAGADDGFFLFTTAARVARAG
jgi:hypothetical protein